jgi:hypothetical protein
VRSVNYFWPVEEIHTAITAGRIRVSESSTTLVVVLVLAGILPDESHSWYTRDLGHLRVNLDLSIAQINTKLFLLLG